MKKLVSNLFALVALLILTACGQAKTTETPASSSASGPTLELVVTKPEGSKSETVAFEEGDSVLEILDAAYDIEETNGFITAIDGLKQDESKNIYWMYKVNGEMADKGAAELEPKAGDKIEFYQETF